MKHKGSLCPQCVKDNLRELWELFLFLGPFEVIVGGAALLILALELWTMLA